MKLHSLILFLLILISIEVNAESSDSLIRMSDLTFNTVFEKNAFENYSTNISGALVEMFLTPYLKQDSFSLTIANQRIADCVNNLQQQTETKSDSKKVKLVYDSVHKTFFKVYKLNNSFSDIFTKGEYNCVSATAMYAIIFSKLKIPYQIKETPQHVYLVAYPETDKILIETTTPDKGYYQFNNDFQEKYVKNLSQKKLVGKAEMDTSSTNALFNKYYFSSDNISLIQLAGIQYCNYAIYHIEEKNYSAAIDELKKAYFLYSFERIRYLLKLALAQEVSNNTYEDMKQVNYLVTLCHFNNLKDEEISNELIRNEFVRVTQSQLISHSDYAKYDSSHFLISGAISDTSLRNDIDFNYHYELARLGLLNSTDTAYELKHLQGAYSINSKNANLQSFILAFFARLIDKNNDAGNMMNTLNLFSTKFSFLNENLQYNSIRGNCLLEMSYRSFEANNIYQGDNYRKEFEALYQSQKNLSVDNKYIEKAYATAAGIYFKKGNYTKSKQIIKNGLFYSPGSWRMKQMLNEF